MTRSRLSVFASHTATADLLIDICDLHDWSQTVMAGIETAPHTLYRIIIFSYYILCPIIY